MFKTSTGRRVSPAAIECRLMRVSGVEQAVVLGAGRKGLLALCACDVDTDDPRHRADIEGALLAELAEIGANDRPQAVLLLSSPRVYPPS